jgi:hypothetical protein
VTLAFCEGNIVHHTWHGLCAQVTEWEYVIIEISPTARQDRHAGILQRDLAAFNTRILLAS